MYNLNKNSLSSRFYTWIWGTDVTTFKTMCPYFWKYVLTIIFLPVILLGKGLYYVFPEKTKLEKAFDYVVDSKVGDAVGTAADKIGSQKKLWRTLETILKWLFFAGCGFVLLGLLIMLGVAVTQNPVEILACIGGVILSIIALGAIVYYFDEYEVGPVIARPFKLFGNMIYSLYKNVCPMIKWKE